jgi:oligoribonuclease (3'-5' exoribonuclease)
VAAKLGEVFRFLTELSPPEFMKFRVIQVSSLLVLETRPNPFIARGPPEKTGSIR